MKLINLLPKPKQEELHYEAMLHSLWMFVILSLLGFALVFFVQLGTEFYLNIEAGVIRQEIADLQGQVDKKENADVKARIKAVNDIASDFNNIAAASPKWSKVLKAFAPLPPSSVNIASFVIDPNQKSITITGQAPTRESVIQLYNNILQDSQDFYGIDYPLENVAKPTDISFHYTFRIQSQLYQ